MDAFIRDCIDQLRGEIYDDTEMDSCKTAWATFDCSELTKSMSFDSVVRMFKARLRTEIGTDCDFKSYYGCPCHYLDYVIDVEEPQIHVEIHLRRQR